MSDPLDRHPGVASFCDRVNFGEQWVVKRGMTITQVEMFSFLMDDNNSVGQQVHCQEQLYRFMLATYNNTLCQ